MDKETKAVLVTGASRGIGAAVATRLVKEGFFVIGTATAEKGVAKIKEALGDKGSAEIFSLEDKDGPKRLVEKAVSERGQLYGLVNNAGLTKDGLVLRMSDEDWSQVVDSNLTGSFRLCREAAKAMITKREGRIINMSSVIAFTGNKGQANYCTAKAGLVGLTRALALELSSRSILVNAVAPGFIDTDMTSNLPDALKEELLSRIPLSRLGKPEDIAASVAFLLGKDSSYITGQVFQVNGGMYFG